MKKAISFLLVMIMSITFFPAHAHEIEEWKLDYYVDVFGDPTDTWYLQNLIPTITTGVGSNMAGLACIQVNQLSIMIELYEDLNVVSGSSSKITNTTSSNKTYRVSVKDADGEKYSFTGTMRSGESDIYVSLENSWLAYTQEETYSTLCNLFANGRPIQFVISPTNNTNQKYTFTVNATDTFEKRYPIVSCSSFSQGLAMVQKVKCGYIDTAGELVIPYEWDDADRFSEGFAAVKRNGKWGYINQSGKLVIPCEWDYAYKFSEGLAVVQKNNKYGFIDTNGKLVVPCNWDYAYWFSEELAVVEKNNKSGYIDTKGNLVIPCEWDSANPFVDGLALVRKGETEFFIDKSGNIRISSAWDSMHSFSDGMSLVEKNNKYGFIDASGKLVVPCEWEKANAYKDGFASVQKNGEWWLIDKKGNQICFLGTWDNMFSFSEGLATVVKSDVGQGCIDTKGNLVIPCQWFYIGSFSENFAYAKSSSEYWIINREGNVIFP